MLYRQAGNPLITLVSCWYSGAGRSHSSTPPRRVNSAKTGRQRYERRCVLGRKSHQHTVKVAQIGYNIQPLACRVTPTQQTPRPELKDIGQWRIEKLSVADDEIWRRSSTRSHSDIHWQNPSILLYTPQTVSPAISHTNVMNMQKSAGLVRLHMPVGIHPLIPLEPSLY